MSGKKLPSSGRVGVVDFLFKFCDMCFTLVALLRDLDPLFDFACQRLVGFDELCRRSLELFFQIVGVGDGQRNVADLNLFRKLLLEDGGDDRKILGGATNFNGDCLRGVECAIEHDFP